MIKFPWGKATLVELTSAATIAPEVKNNKTRLLIEELAHAATVNLDIHDRLLEGATLMMDITCDATLRVLTLGTGFNADMPPIAIPASKRVLMFFEFDGTEFNPINIINVDEIFETGVDVQAKAYAAPVAATITHKHTQLTIAQMTGAATLNLTVDGVKKGSRLVVFVSADGTNRNLTLGTGLSGPVSVIAANKSFSIVFEFDGTNFVQTGLALQLN